MSTTNMIMSFSNEELEIIERLALATINGEGFLVDKLWKSFFPKSHPLENEKYYLEIVRTIHQKETEIISKRRKRKRIKKKLLNWEKQGDLYFATLTFTDEQLKTTTKEERRKAVRSDLNATGDNYIANADYGDLGGREHYHALVLNLNGQELKRRRKEIGFVDYEKVSRTLGLAIDYCMKLTNHALKDSTDGKIIYCRKTKKKEQDAINLLDDDLPF